MPKVGTTSITVNPLTLKWVNAIRSFFEYQTGYKYSLDETIFWMTVEMDYQLSRGFDGKKTLTKEEYFESRIVEFISKFNDRDYSSANTFLKYANTTK